jgi:hypothetical protein
MKKIINKFNNSETKKQKNKKTKKQKNKKKQKNNFLPQKIESPPKNEI